MGARVAIDWLTSSIEQRKALYRRLRQIIDREGEDWNSIFRGALGETAAPGQGYEDNFRAGRIARTKAHRLYHWMAAAYPSYAAALADALSGGETVSASGTIWDDWLARHGRFEDVDVILADDPAVGLVTFARSEPLAQPVIPLGASFYFRVIAEEVGRVIAWQSVGGRWHGLPLKTDSLADEVVAGVNILPKSSGSDHPIPLTEERDDGRHGFAFLIGDPALIAGIAAMVPDGAMSAALLDDIARRILDSDRPWSLHRINLLFQA